MISSCSCSVSTACQLLWNGVVYLTVNTPETTMLEKPFHCWLLSEYNTCNAECLLPGRTNSDAFSSFPLQSCQISSSRLSYTEAQSHLHDSRQSVSPSDVLMCLSLLLFHPALSYSKLFHICMDLVWLLCFSDHRTVCFHWTVCYVIAVVSEFTAYEMIKGESVWYFCSTVNASNLLLVQYERVTVHTEIKASSPTSSALHGNCCNNEKHSPMWDCKSLTHTRIHSAMQRFGYTWSKCE